MVGLEVQLDFDILATLYFFSLILFILFHFISLAGCTVSLLEASAVEAFKEFVGKKYGNKQIMSFMLLFQHMELRQSCKAIFVCVS